MRAYVVTSVVAIVLTGGATLTAQTRSTPSVRPPGLLALRGVAVVDVRVGRIVPDQTVVIDGGRIREVGRASTVRVPAGAHVLDGTGKYIIPGLWDMHSHFDEKDLPQSLAYGVTGVRAMGDCNPTCLPAAERERMLTNLRGQMVRLPADARRQIYAKKLEMTLRGYRAGVRVLVGTDSPFAGSSLHEELNELVAAGLIPGEVLKAATFDAAEFQGRTADFGSIETGQRADMVVLNADPLAAIQNALKIDSVILGGRYLDRSALDALLSGKP